MNSQNNEREVLLKSISDIYQSNYGIVPIRYINSLSNEQLKLEKDNLIKKVKKINDLKSTQYGYFKNTIIYIIYFRIKTFLKNKK